MSARLKRNFGLLKVLQKASPKQWKALLKNASNELVLCIAEIVSNVLKGNVKVNAKQHAQLRKYKRVLRTLINKRISVKSKKRLLSQKGGFLSALLGPAIGVIGSLLGNILQR